MPIHPLTHSLTRSLTRSLFLDEKAPQHSRLIFRALVSTHYILSTYFANKLLYLLASSTSRAHPAPHVRAVSSPSPQIPPHHTAAVLALSPTSPSLHRTAPCPPSARATSPAPSHDGRLRSRGARRTLNTRRRRYRSASRTRRGAMRRHDDDASASFRARGDGAFVAERGFLLGPGQRP